MSRSLYRNAVIQHNPYRGISRTPGTKTHPTNLTLKGFHRPIVRPSATLSGLKLRAVMRPQGARSTATLGCVIKRFQRTERPLWDPSREAWKDHCPWRRVDGLSPAADRPGDRVAR